MFHARLGVLGRIASPLLITLATAALTVGCATSSRFADGRSDVVGDPIDLDAGTRYVRSNDAPASVYVPPAAALEQATLAGRVPASWQPRVQARPWQFVVVHHSATHTGGANRFDGMHRGNGWDELGYHFVIGNGTDTPDGAVEVGPRWTKQKHGAHAKTADNRFNELGVGICLVGNFDQEQPTRRQMHSLAVLTAHLMQQYHIPPGRVIGHGDTKPTACPGMNLHGQLANLRRTAAGLASTGNTPSGHAAVR